MLHGAESVEEFLGLYPALALSISAGLRSLLAVPLIKDGRIIGSLILRSIQVNYYSQREAEMMERVASQISGALYNTQLRDELERTIEERETLSRIGRIVSSSLNIDEVYGSLVEEVRKLIPADRVTIDLINVESQTFKRACA